MIELTDEEKKLLNKSDLFYDLMNENYWDVVYTVNGYGRLQTRMEYDVPTCRALKKLVVKLFQTGGSKD